MSYSLQSTTSLSSLGDAIRSKTGGSSQMTVEEMITAVNSIVAGSSSSGWIKRKEFDRRDSSSITRGSYIDVDIDLEQDREFIFILTTQMKTEGGTAAPGKMAYLLMYDGSSLTSKGICGGSNGYAFTFAVNYDSSNQVNVLRINNTDSSDVDLTKGGYSKDGYNVWGNLFYLDESFKDVATINIPVLNSWCKYATVNDNVINTVFDKLTFVIPLSYNTIMLTDAFSGYRGTKYDWTDKEIVLTGKGTADIVSMSNFCKGVSDNTSGVCAIRYPMKIVSSNYPFSISECEYTFSYCKLVEMRSDFFPSNFIFGGAGRKYLFFINCHFLRRVPDNFLAEMWANSINNISYSSVSNILSAWMYSGSWVLPKVLGLPVTIGNSSVISFNTFNSCVNDCYSLHRLTFYMPNGSPATANLVNQTVDLSVNVGYWPSSGGWNLDGIKGFLLEDADKNNAFLINSANDATGANVENLNSYAVSVDYATYTRKSAVETINSLPDTSAALAAANANGGTYTNTIKFNYGAGSAYGNDYYMASLSAAEIAVATAKGWTVTLL